MLVVFLGIDYGMGPYIAFPVAFIIPIAFATWWYGRWTGIGIATLLVLARVGGATKWELPVPNLMSYVIINAIIRETVFVLLVLLVERVAIQQRLLTEKVQVLEGILPICAHCKKIRNENNEWEQVESYITRHSTAMFSHGICPPCSQQHFGDYLKAHPQKQRNEYR
jgi:hypothetical protein